MGENYTPQWHFGNGPGQPPTSCHMSAEGLRQGETTTNVFFNIVAARLYKAFSVILNERGILPCLADDCNILGSPDVVNEVVQQLPALAMSEAGLTTQTTKNKIYVQPSARTAWLSYLEENPRNPDPNVFSIHDIADGRLPPTEEHVAFYDPEAGPT